MASIHERHGGVARVTPHRQLRALHPAADDGAGTRSRQPTAAGPDPGPVRSITPGKAPDPQTGPRSPRPDARERQHPPARKNRGFVIGSDGTLLVPCTVRRARQLMNAGRVSRRDYPPLHHPPEGPLPDEARATAYGDRPSPVPRKREPRTRGDREDQSSEDKAGPVADPGFGPKTDWTSARSAPHTRG